MICKEWRDGYLEGFKDGYDKAFRDNYPKPIKISDPGPVTPDGLSYEEIYGSVVYQQNKKKE